MYDYVIVHGSYGHPFENWSPWLFDVLSSTGKQVLAPQFPCINQCYENWKKLWTRIFLLSMNTHRSLATAWGQLFILDFILDNDIKVNNLYFAAPFYGLINIKDFDDVNKTFLSIPI